MGIRFLIRWAIQALVAGIFAALLVRLFDLSLSRILEYRRFSPLPPLLFPPVAALLTGLLLYRFAPGTAGEGIPAYLEAIRDRESTLPIGDTCAKFPAALLALGFGGSGGIVGPLGRVIAGLSQWVTLNLRRFFPHLFEDVDDANLHYHAPTTAAITGMAAAVAAIFHAPIAGAVFAVEIIQRDQLRYHQLFPALLASSTTVFFMDSLAWQAPFRVPLPDLTRGVASLPAVIAVGLVSGGVGRFYTSLYRVLSHRLGRRQRKNQILRLTGGMLAASLITLAVHPVLTSTSMALPSLLTSGDIAELAIPWLPVGGALLLAFLLLAKMVGNCITVASGMSAGFTGPAALIGMTAGAAMALIFGYDPGGAEYISLIVAGFAGTLASTMNIPLAAAILAIEVFSPLYGVVAGVAAILGFQMARYTTIYEAALETRRSS